MTSSNGSGAQTLVIREWLLQTDTTASRHPRGHQHHFFTSVLTVNIYSNIHIYLDERGLHEWRSFICLPKKTKQKNKHIISVLPALRKHVVYPVTIKHLQGQRRSPQTGQHYNFCISKSTSYFLGVNAGTESLLSFYKPQTFSISHRAAALFQEHQEPVLWRRLPFFNFSFNHWWLNTAW